MASDKTIQLVALCSRSLVIIRYTTRPFPTTVSRDRNAPRTRLHIGYGEDSILGKKILFAGNVEREKTSTRNITLYDRVSALTAHVFSDQNCAGIARIKVTVQCVHQWEAGQLLPSGNCSSAIRTFPFRALTRSHPQLKLGSFLALNVTLYEETPTNLRLSIISSECKCENAGNQLHPCDSLDEPLKQLWIQYTLKYAHSFTSIDDQ